VDGRRAGGRELTSDMVLLGRGFVCAGERFHVAAIFANINVAHSRLCVRWSMLVTQSRVS